MYLLGEKQRLLLKISKSGSQSPKMTSDLAWMLTLKCLRLKCDSLQDKKWGHGPQATGSSPTRCVCQQHCDPGRPEQQSLCLQHKGQKSNTNLPTPSQAWSCPRGTGVWDHTLFICGSFKWCPETYISCLFESVYVTGEAVKQQLAFTLVIYLFSYMSAWGSLSHNSF
jgi:hypothetical protein